MKVAIVGEAMLEYRGTEQSSGGLHYGGDTLNTAIHLARTGRDVAYLTALGQDPLSDALVADWKRQGLDIGGVLRHPDRQPGIYAIHLDSQGERSFLYWRDDSAARVMFDLPESDYALAEAAKAGLLYFSHISLAILAPPSRERLLALAADVRRRGGLVAYDSNYRPRLWQDRAEAQHWSDRAIAMSSIGLPTAEDELAMQGCPASAEDIARRWHRLGCPEVAVKCGPLGPLVSIAGKVPIHHECKPVLMVDSSGAGDAFNAGYLAARLIGIGPKEAAQRGHELAAWVVTQPGALPSISAGAPYHYKETENRP